GCTLEYGDASPLDGVRVPARPAAGAARWPEGDDTGPANDGMQALLADMLAADNAAGLDTRALLVARAGRVIAEAYADGIDSNTPLLGWSMGKSVTAIMVGRLEYLGLLKPDERALFPAWAQDERAQISLEDMLQMSSGLRFVEDYVPGSDATRMLFESPSAAQVAVDSPLAHAPGTHFYYSSGTTNLLSLLVYQRAGDTAQAQVDFFQREIAAPLGLRNTTLEADASGVFVGSSFVYAPARDWARFGQLLLNAGQINGERVLSEDWVRRARQPNGSENDRRYGYQLWLNAGGDPWWPSLPRSAYAMQGNRNQLVMMLPEHNVVIVRLGWTPDDYPADANVARILAALER
ncbi:MAG: serine hydrolase, partial [Halioglobus sp.]|nr:serine hydrolase [Halioglobus sp.]